MLEYNAEKHEYKTDGVVIPSVTQIISNKDIFKYVNEKYMKAGTNRHKAIEAWLKYQLITEGYEEIIASYSSELLKVQKIYGKTLAIEKPLIGELQGMKYAGTPDVILEAAIVDFKSNINNLKYYELQLTAYALLAEYNNIGSRRKELILIGKKGSRIASVNIKNNYKDAKNMFAKLLKKWYIEQEYQNYLKEA